MLVRDVGETRLIAILTDILRREGHAQTDSTPGPLGSRLLVPIGDDAAVWDGPTGVTASTSDALVEGVHFDLDLIGWKDLGWKSIAVNLSDLAAMGCSPLYVQVALGLRGDLPVDGLEELYVGMVEACSEHGGRIVGGDIVRSPTLFVAVSMVGASVRAERSPKGRGLLLRGTASAGQTLAVTGPLGCSRGGLAMLTQRISFDSETADHLKAAHNRPAPRLAEGALLARHGAATAIDLSDGLVADVEKMCVGAGAVIYADRVPVDEFLKRAFPGDWLPMALTGGEDYELAFAADADVVEHLESHPQVGVSAIGEVTNGPGVTVFDSRGEPIAVDRAGWDHFSVGSRR